MLSGLADATSLNGNGREDALLAGGIVGGDEVPSKPVYPGIDLIAAIAAGLNGPYGEPVSIPLLGGNPKCPGDGPDSRRFEDGDLDPEEGERDRESEFS
jgi:hypothetical protein